LADDQPIREAVAAYEKRKEKLRSGIYRAGVIRPKSEISPRKRAFWRAVPQTPGYTTLPVSVPKLNKVFPAPNWLPVPDVEWHMTIQWLGVNFDARLKELFGLSALELEICLSALSLVVERQAQCGWMSEGVWRDRPALIINTPADAASLEEAAKHLVSLLQRGSLRNPSEPFCRAIAGELSGLGVLESDALARRFFKAFRGVPKPMGLPEPLLFCEQDELTCVLDLSAWDDFIDALIAKTTSGDGPWGNLRGDAFEHQVREAVMESLSLTNADIPWPANRDVISGGKNLGDVDFCFSCKGVLFNLDMKSWQRSSDYHIGHYHSINERQQTLIRQLTKADRRGQALLQLLKTKGCRHKACLTFLVVAMPEYLAPGNSSLWYGPPAKRPRVITVEELCSLVTNDSELEETVRLAP
jgi:hypothetical protein